MDQLKKIRKWSLRYIELGTLKSNVSTILKIYLDIVLINLKITYPPM